jgi:hypothetical protein
MARPPVFPAEEKVRIVLSILAGEITVAEAAAAGEGVRAVGRELEASVPRSRQDEPDGWQVRALDPRAAA